MPTRILVTVDPARSRVDARTEDGHSIAMDGDPPDGDGSAAGPKETLLAALAACTAMDVAAILRKKRQAAATYEIEVSAESASEHPKVFTAIAVEHQLSGNLDPEAVRRSVELSSTRYCPVNAMLSKAVPIEHRYRLTRADGRTVVALVSIVGPEGARVL